MKIEDYLRENGIMVTFFAQQVGITYATLRSIITGRSATNIDLINTIEILTHRNVRFEDILEARKAWLKKNHTKNIAEPIYKKKK